MDRHLNSRDSLDYFSSRRFQLREVCLGGTYDICCLWIAIASVLWRKLKKFPSMFEGTTESKQSGWVTTQTLIIQIFPPTLFLSLPFRRKNLLFSLKQHETKWKAKGTESLCDCELGKLKLLRGKPFINQLERSLFGRNWFFPVGIDWGAFNNLSHLSICNASALESRVIRN